MTFKQLKENKVIKIITNRYFIVSVIFLIWMLFIDENSYLTHRKLDKEIDKLENSIDYYQKEINKDKKVISNLKDPDSLERFAREEYKMKKKNEEIYIIDFDTIKE
ncbi:MAG: septum formation initiator [Flavobacteriia bacterium]|nr:MAG: septum formation initiator [Flavobacteriia bacterium]